MVFELLESEGLYSPNHIPQLEEISVFMKSKFGIVYLAPSYCDDNNNNNNNNNNGGNGGNGGGGGGGSGGYDDDDDDDDDNL